MPPKTIDDWRAAFEEALTLIGAGTAPAGAQQWHKHRAGERWSRNATAQ